MGQVHSAQKSFRDYISYISVVIPPCKGVDPNVKLEVRESTMKVMFIDGANQGLFTRNSIPANTIIMKMPETCMMNDGLVDLTKLLSAITDIAIYDAWKELEASYYNEEKMRENINVRMVFDGRYHYYQTIKDVPAGAELLRVYGFTTWIMELYHLFSRNYGFLRFLNEVNINGDPLEHKIKALRLNT